MRRFKFSNDQSGGHVQNKSKKPPTKAEAAHIERVKAQPCSVCDAAGPSDCHEPEQGLWFASIALCRDCHMGAKNGWHGQKIMWRVMKMDELRALAKTVERLQHA